MEVFLKLVRAG